MLLIIAAAVPVVIWLYLLFARGGFWRVSPALADIPVTPVQKRIVAVIPARNEAAHIGGAIRSLLDQDFPAPLHVVVVDDQSADGTAEAARAEAERTGGTARVTVIPGKPLIPGWTGKLWAVSQAIEAAAALDPDYLLLTDADILHSRTSVAELVRVAESLGCDLASYMVKLRCETAAEKFLMPAFVFFFLMLYPPRWIAARRKKTAGAAGGCILIRPEALKRIGGLSAIRNEVIDDCALGRAVKRSGGRIWMGLTPHTESMRGYGTAAEIGRMISRTAFNQLHHSAVMLVLTLLALSVTFLLPVGLLFSRSLIPAALGIIAWFLMAAAYRPMVRFYQLSPWRSFGLPLVALFYAAATLHSALQYWRGKGGEWKGRIQDLRASG